ncbi:MAG TPA: tRNA preQ1(34) S-adenosylmethionine ribosyltransferase-isomerase QueA [bacterium]|jgi:S-adenosylmethionine:tRNA ribosyltransferase-isomerase
MRLSDFDYTLPPELIAQHPVFPRDAARLLVVERATERITHHVFSDLPQFLRPHDLIVINDTKVIPARLRGRKRTGAGVELLLLRPAPNSPPAPRGGPIWEALVRPARRVPAGTVLQIAPDVSAEIVDVRPDGVRLAQFHTPIPVMELLQRVGEVPLPPYIHDRLERSEDYQTVYAAAPGAVAAPTAGLHFTEGLIARIAAMGVPFATITMHIGLGTFRPVSSDDITAHQMDAEWFDVTPEAAVIINDARRRGGRVVVVGTSAVRTLETVVDGGGVIRDGAGWSTLFIYPGFRFAATDALVTNFHLPKTTLLMLVSAFAGRELVLRAYADAVAQRYRFYSFGDAMLTL